ncbi:MAG: hypothetical protein ABI091_05570 [Ferruginibacter sp.]
MDNKHQQPQRKLLFTHIANFLFLVGFAMFAGCILSSIVMNGIISHDPTAISFYYERLFITRMVYFLTIPGMWIMFACGLYLTIQNHEGFFRRTRFGLAQSLAVLILLNGTFVLTPLVGKVTALANEGMTKGIISPMFTLLKSREDTFGLINFLLLVCCLLLIVSNNFEKKMRSSGLSRF